MKQDKILHETEIIDQPLEFSYHDLNTTNFEAEHARMKKKNTKFGGFLVDQSI